METEQKEIEEGNKLIAEFFTDKKTVRSAGGARAYVILGKQVRKEKLEFHKSWDCLMPVVEKIEDIKNEDGTYLFSIDTGRDYCLIYFNDFMQRTISVKSSSGSKIKSVWLAVVEFIKWFNNQKQ